MPERAQAYCSHVYHSTSCGEQPRMARAAPRLFVLTVTTNGWVRQGAPNLTGWTTLDLPFAVRGCAFTKQGVLVVSGEYAGTYAGQTSNGTRMCFWRS